MELDPKKSKALKISLVILAVILLLAIGGALGLGFSHHRGYTSNGYGCSNVGQFERGNRGQRQGGRQFRMMAPQAFNANQDGQVQSVVQTQAPVVNQAKTTIATTTPAK